MAAHGSKPNLGGIRTRTASARLSGICSTELSRITSRSAQKPIQPWTALPKSQPWRVPRRCRLYRIFGNLRDAGERKGRVPASHVQRHRPLLLRAAVLALQALQRLVIDDPILLGKQVTHLVDVAHLAMDNVVAVALKRDVRDVVRNHALEGGP